MFAVYTRAYNEDLIGLHISTVAHADPTRKFWGGIFLREQKYSMKLVQFAFMLTSSEKVFGTFIAKFT